MVGERSQTVWKVSQSFRYLSRSRVTERALRSRAAVALHKVLELLYSFDHDHDVLAKSLQPIMACLGR